jgi:hypothetical protein
VSGRALLVIVASLQGLFVVLLLVFLLVRRAQNRRFQGALELAHSGLPGPLRAWLVDGGEPEAVLRELRLVPEGAAVGFLALLAKHTIAASDADRLRARLVDEGWVRRALAGWNSRLWWRRLDAARACALMAGPDDRDRVLSLLDDAHPAVQISACAALPRVLDDVAVGRILDRMDAMPKVVRQGVTLVLQPFAHRVGPALAARISSGQRRHEVATWIEFAEHLNNIDALRTALGRAQEEFVPIRRACAKALRRLPFPESEAALLVLLVDRDTSVRAAAARTLGLMESRTALPALTAALSDPVWLVRVRAAVALAQAGEPGRAALRVARNGPDRYARDMAFMVANLSDGALLDIGEA